MGREEHCEQISLVCEKCSQCPGHTGFACTHGLCAFLVYTAQAPGCSAGAPSKAGPGLCALPRSKTLKFRFSGTPQRHRLGWACVLCLSQVRAAQVTRCLASTVAPSWRLHLITSPVPATLFWVYNRHAFSSVPCVSSRKLISGCNTPSGSQPSRIPRSLG